MPEPAAAAAAPVAGTRDEKIVIVMPAYNAARTIEETFRAIPEGYYDEIVVVDDHSRDDTMALARALQLKAIRHPHNVGYGGNQKTCYMEALRDGATIVVMLHPDGQYDPEVIPEMIRPIREGRADMVLGSRMLVPGAAKRGGMPLWKRIANRFLTTTENLAMGRRFTECHTGYRAYSRRFLETVPFLRNSNGFVFDTEVIFQAVHFGLPVVEVPVASRYFDDASSVGFRQGVVYGLGTLWTAARFLGPRWGLAPCEMFWPSAVSFRGAWVVGRATRNPPSTPT
jgi:glycosyltransferase involved in cell wall biosynthesis